MIEDQTLEDQEIEIEDEDSLEEDIFPDRYSISSYGADYVVDALVKRMESDDIHIPPFQREFIWSQIQSSRFIESLLLGLPVPGIFLSKDDESRKLLVIDGQQRLRTLQYFYGGIFGASKKEFSLIGVQKRFEDLTYKKLSQEDRRQLNDSIIHATIIRQDAPQEDNTSVHHIFERLNTFGTPLTHQEIRATIYLGEFNDLLEVLNDNIDWRKVYGRKSKRRKDQEFILRFFALFYNLDKYSPPIRKFLNNFMFKNRHLKQVGKNELSKIFTSTIEVISKNLGNKAFRLTRALNAAVFDAVMVGVAKRLQNGPIKNDKNFLKQYEKLLKSDPFKKAIETGTTAKTNSVRNRIDEATKAFGNVE